MASSNRAQKRAKLAANSKSSKQVDKLQEVPTFDGAKYAAKIRDEEKSPHQAALRALDALNNVIVELATPDDRFDQFHQGTLAISLNRLVIDRAHLVRLLDALPDSEVIRLGEVNQHLPVRYGGVVAPSYVELTMGVIQRCYREFLPEHWLADQLRITGNENPALSEFAGRVITKEDAKLFRVIYRATEHQLPVIDRDELHMQLLCEWRRFWKAGGKKGDNPTGNRPGRKRETERNAEWFEQYKTGVFGPPGEHGTIRNMADAKGLSRSSISKILKLAQAKE